MILSRDDAIAVNTNAFSDIFATNQFSWNQSKVDDFSYEVVSIDLMRKDLASVHKK